MTLTSFLICYSGHDPVMLDSSRKDLRFEKNTEIIRLDHLGKPTVSPAAFDSSPLSKSKPWKKAETSPFGNLKSAAETRLITSVF